MMITDLKSLTINELEQITKDFGAPKFNAGYIFKFIHQKNTKQVDNITPLSKALRAGLNENGYYISDIKLVKKFVDPDSTVKYLFEFADGARIESVLLTDDGRKTLCISTQVGCQMECVFCATGKIKFQRNLSAGEIVSQVYFVNDEIGKVNNVVYMGMGEPFLNYTAVVKSLRILNNKDGLNIGAKHLTVSTCGLCEHILDFADEGINARLAVSLHGADEATRNKLMAVNKKYPIKKLFDSVRGYQRKTGNRVTFEYILIDGVNDSENDADRLVKLLKSVKCNVNLIEYNQHPGCGYEPSSRNSIRRFADVLKRARIETVIRFKRGQQINAACGQLGADSIVR